MKQGGRAENRAAPPGPGLVPATGWSRWSALPNSPVFSDSTLAELLDGGQSFRWYRQPDSSWLGVWADCVARLRLSSNAQLEWCAPASIRKHVARELAYYLALDAYFDRLEDALPWRSDAHLSQCLQSFPGLRILRQPFGETLLCFLCSATKQIVQIKQMTALLASRLGSEIAAGFHRLPTWHELRLVPEKDLRDCLLGFRARHIHQTAQFLAERPGWLAETETLPYAEAKTRLCELPGVGEKVADCVLLFGAGRLEAFPVDVWILKTMARRYGLDGWRPAQVAHFGRTHFGAAAGLAQQFLFAWERAAARAAKRRAEDRG